MTPITTDQWTRRAWDFCDNEHEWDDPCLKCQQLADAFRTAIAAARAEERERCAKVVCRFCAMDWPVEDRPGWGFYHFNADGGPDQKCEAAAIRTLASDGPRKGE